MRVPSQAADENIIAVESAVRLALGAYGRVV
jgi:hypothetical protein